MDKVLVTGAGGFIGSHVVDALVESGKRVTALDRPGVPIHRRDLRPIAATIDDVDDLARVVLAINPSVGLTRRADTHGAGRRGPVPRHSARWDALAPQAMVLVAPGPGPGAAAPG